MHLKLTTLSIYLKSLVVQELHTDNLEAACNGSKSYEKEIDDGKGQQEISRSDHIDGC